VNSLGRIGLVVGALILGGCAPQPPAAPPDTRAADEAAIRAAIKEWSASAQAKDADRFASFYAPDAVLMLEDVPDFHGRAAIRDAVVGMMQDPNFALSFTPDSVVVARSGDLAYEAGAFALTTTDAGQKPSTEKGHYVVVWQKQPDGGWKAVRDAPVSDPPEDAAAH